MTHLYSLSMECRGSLTLSKACCLLLCPMVVSNWPSPLAARVWSFHEGTNSVISHQPSPFFSYDKTGKPKCCKRHSVRNHVTMSV